MAARMPVVFIPHGGGPWPFVEMGFHPSTRSSALAELPAGRQRAAAASRRRRCWSCRRHWEEPVPTVMTSPQPPMLYDYYGFPPESYQHHLARAGRPGAGGAGADAARRRPGSRAPPTTTRGFDHGTFVPLKLTYPDADVPAMQLSLNDGLDPAEHLAIGRALAPLRDEGVFIVGSGMTFHNLRAFRDPRGRAGRRDVRRLAARRRDAATPDERDRAPGALGHRARPRGWPTRARSTCCR